MVAFRLWLLLRETLFQPFISTVSCQLNGDLFSRVDTGLSGKKNDTTQKTKEMQNKPFSRMAASLLYELSSEPSLQESRVKQGISIMTKTSLYIIFIRIMQLSAHRKSRIPALHCFCDLTQGVVWPVLSLWKQIVHYWKANNKH